MPSKYGFGNTRKKSPVYKKPIYGEVQRNPIQKKMETLPGIDTKLDAKSPVRKNGRSKTKGPVVTDTRVSTSDGKSRKIGPEQSPQAIKKERQEYITQKKKTGEFSKETSKEYKEFAEADAYRKR